MDSSSDLKKRTSSGDQDEMSDREKTIDQLLEEMSFLRARLQEAEGALQAIRNGEVDALVVSSTEGDQVFTLQGAEHPYRIMVETMNEGAATVLDDGSILYANPRLAAILGEPLETLIGSSILDYISPDDSKTFEGLVEQSFRSSSQAEIHLQCNHQPSVPVLLSFSPTQVEGAQALCLVATDLTEQKRSEEIVTAERLTRSILDQAAEAILVCDTDGKIIRANQAAYQVFPHNPLYKRFEETLPLVYPQPDNEGRNFSIDRVLSGESFHEVEVEYINGQSRNRYFLLSAAPLLKQESQVIGCVVTLTEMTERKRDEELIRSYSARLEQSNQELQAFAFTASHDLQEPLRKIEAFSTQLEKRTNLDPNDQEYLRRMKDAAGRMQKMIDALLELSRISTTTKPYLPVDLNEVVRTVVEDLEPRIRKSQGKVILHSLPVIEADRVQMHQLFQNLIVNAVKYHRPDTPPLVQISYRQGPAGWVKIEVQDNGIGFEMTYASLIFQPFRRLHGRSEYEGSGMGLAICRKIVERHGGRITAQSTPGLGSTFSVILPLKQFKK